MRDRPLWFFACRHNCTFMNEDLSLLCSSHGFLVYLTIILALQHDQKHETVRFRKYVSNNFVCERYKGYDNSLYLNLSHQKHRKIFDLYNETVARIEKNDTVRENSHVSHNIL